MLKVAQSKKKIHIISGLDTGTIEKNIIKKDLGIEDVFEGLVHYSGSGDKDYKMSHIKYNTSNGEKIILILGYDDKARWKKALGGQYGCLYIDEINIADMEYVREASMRCDYLMATLNPDDPNLPIYKEYINCSRPLEKYKDDGPSELLQELREPAKPKWVWWFFSFKHNLGLSQEKIDQIIMNVPVGTKLYKNKILGLRGKATGLVFSNFNAQKHVISKAQAKQFHFVQFTCGVDTAYSSKSDDTIAFIFAGITACNKCIILDERVYNNAELHEPLAPSDTVINLIEFLDRNKDEWGMARNLFIDSADQATLKEFSKYKLKHGSIYVASNAWKKTKIIDRINMQLGWLAKGDYLVLDHCQKHIHELNSYSWQEKKDNTPEDKNDHTINASQYGWLPYVKQIGGQ